MFRPRLTRRGAATLLAAASLVAIAGPAAAVETRTAVYAGGCYWTVERDMEKIDGVMNVVAGFAPFAPGEAPADANHKAPQAFEAVRVTYDPAKISYAQLTARYLRLTDPTDAGGAFCDRGAHYRPAIFYSDAAEQTAAKAAITAAQPMVRKPIVTAVLPARAFRAAPKDQQDWARKNPERYANYRAGCGKDRVLKVIWISPGG